MFKKGDGSIVWLKTEDPIPYFAIDGHMDTGEEYNRIRERLANFYDSVKGVTSGDAFLISEVGKQGALIFCVKSNNRCALLILGEWHEVAQNNTSGWLLPDFFDHVRDGIRAISEIIHARITVSRVRCEVSVHFG
jgi:hypothetical protein